MKFRPPEFHSQDPLDDAVRKSLGERKEDCCYKIQTNPGGNFRYKKNTVVRAD